nr:uncharacterized protein LOC123773711 isoform X2 [Procambarus clarkii]
MTSVLQPEWREAGSPSNCNTEEGSGGVVRGQQRSGVRTQPAWARTNPSRFASPSSGASSGGSDVDGDHTSQRPPAGKAAGGTASQPPPLSADAAGAHRAGSGALSCHKPSGHGNYRGRPCRGCYSRPAPHLHRLSPTGQGQGA